MRVWLAVVVLAGCGNDAAPLAWGIGTARFDARASRRAEPRTASDASGVRFGQTTGGF